MSIVNKFKIKLLGYRATSESYLKELKEKGADIGEDVFLYRPYNTTIDIQNPCLLSIGNHVMITGPVTILTHDYSWSVLKRKYGYIAGNQKKVKIGNNIFIGWGATILAGSTIGDNTIIGANSVVHGNLEGNAVYAGNPAKYLMSLDEYYHKRLDSQLDEAFSVVLEYKKTTGDFPPEEILNEYFFLFMDGDDNDLLEVYDSQLRLMGNYEESLEVLKSGKPVFSGYECFLEYCEERLKNESTN